MKYAWIERHKSYWPVSRQCEVLNVSTSGYFGHQRRRIADNPAIPGKRISDTALLIHIKAVLQPAKANMAGQGFGESFELIVCEFGKNGFDDS